MTIDYLDLRSLNALTTCGDSEEEEVSGGGENERIINETTREPLRDGERRADLKI